MTKEKKMLELGALSKTTSLLLLLLSSVSGSFLLTATPLFFCNQPRIISAYMRGNFNWLRGYIIQDVISTLRVKFTKYPLGFYPIAGSVVSWLPYVVGVLGVFTVVTMWAVVVTEGCRKIKLQYYGFKLASTAREDSPITEVEPYIPFNINPSGMQPILTTTYLLAFPSILASLLGSSFWAYVKEILNPETSLGAEPWIYYSIYAFFVFVFNIFDIANMPKEIADYLNKMGARIPNIKPGKATIEYLTKIQASTRFWGICPPIIDKRKKADGGPAVATMP
ncbi:hypothetical protein RJ639_023092 [Escallonia herrerae]|uniref:Uncharacterized protein n=1 Tax=Escallonia herrerae TaxID=1293975 RepID=A0AA88UZU0_9ASTE|nr:hypothetical protein RJ639_023092 [Escallonia herrerae]